MTIWIAADDDVAARVIPAEKSREPDDPGFSSEYPTIFRNGHSVGISPSPNGSGLRIWWRANSQPIGWTDQGADTAVRIALWAAEVEYDEDEVQREAARIDRVVRTTNWYRDAGLIDRKVGGMLDEPTLRHIVGGHQGYGSWEIVYEFVAADQGGGRLPEELQAFLTPLRCAFERTGRVPAGTDVDTLRSWLYLLQRLDYWSGGGALGRDLASEFVAVWNSLLMHPAAGDQVPPPLPAFSGACERCSAGTRALNRLGTLPVI